MFYDKESVITYSDISHVWFSRKNDTLFKHSDTIEFFICRDRLFCKSQRSEVDFCRDIPPHKKNPESRE